MPSRSVSVALELVVGAGVFIAVLTVVDWRVQSLDGYGLRYERVGKAAGLDWRLQRELPHGAHPIRWHGQIYLPMSGRYQFFAAGSGEVELRAAERRARQPLTTSLRALVTLESGRGHIPIEIVHRSTGSGTLRLMWRPPDAVSPRLIPPSLLVATGGSRRAQRVPPGDFAAMALLLSLLSCWGAWALRRKIGRGLLLLVRSAGARMDAAAFFLIVALSFAIRIWDQSLVGPLAGESEVVDQAHNVLHALLAGDASAATWRWADGRLHAVGLLFASAAVFSNAFEAARMVGAVLSAMACGVLFFAARQWAGRAVGVVASLLAALAPPLVAHGRVLSPEGGGPLFALLVLWLFARATRQGGDGGPGRDSDLVLVGLALGMAFAIEPVLAAALGLSLVTLTLYQSRALLSGGRIPLPWALWLLPGVAAATFIATQPGLWRDTLGGIARIVLAPMPRLAVSWSDAVPVALLMAAVIGALRLLARFSARGESERKEGALLILSATLFILLLSQWHPTSSAGISIWVILLAALGLELLALAFARLLKQPALGTPSLAFMSAALGLYLLFSLTSVHPYALAYRNEMSETPSPGGRGESRRGEGVRALLRRIERFPETGRRVFFEFSLGSPLASLSRRVEASATIRGADFVVTHRPDPPEGFVPLGIERAGKRVLLHAFRRVAP